MALQRRKCTWAQPTRRAALIAGAVAVTRAHAQLPPIDSCRMRVSTELRKGTCDAVFAVVSAEMTLPSARREVLIFWASESETPVAPERPTSSEPARSHSVSVALVVFAMTAALST